MIYQRGNAAKQWILEQIEERFAKNETRILDLGCGDGSKWPTFLNTHPLLTVTGIDIDRVAIARGISANASTRLALRVADAQKPVTEQYDVVTAFSAIEHVVDRAAFLKTVWSALKPGGIAFLNYDDGHFRSSNIKERLMVPISQLLALVSIQGPYMKHVDDATFRKQAEAQGFSIVDFRKHNIASLKGFMKKQSDENIAAWYAFEEQLGRLNNPEKLDKMMLSSTLVVQKT